ncbi:aminodeoxychorismate synthase component I [Gayadomonas joobiniege]|uniref:aminodeoxychorismate synthase component I n=1 Tax=Gayadomonas joobiniege TaxID=1234606 RepID=UPI000381D1B2
MSYDTKANPFITELNLAAELDAAAVFEPVANDKGAIFLDSANADHENSRYDILLCEPLAQIKYHQGTTQTRLLNGAYISESQDDPFKIARRLHRDLMPETLIDSELPFIGGTVGYFAYDLGRSIESIESIAQCDLTADDLHLGIYDWAIIKDNKQHRWYALDYQPELERIDKWLTKYRQNTSNNSNSFALLSEWRSNMTETEYQQKFNQVFEYLKAGDCYQVNLAQRFCAQYSGDPWVAYKKLRKANKAPFSAYLKTQTNSILSISPERFLQLDSGRVESKPIKGTLPRGQSLKLDSVQKQKLQKSPKDRAENLMIVDLLRNDISRVCQPGTVRVPKLFEVESFPSVHHLVSTITGEINEDKNAFDLLKACFPGGSITGAPKVRAMQIIEELEPHRRHIYCGAIGYIDWRDKMDMNIAIRTLITENDNIYCWAGGGLVYDSKCASEYRETYDKLNHILPILSRG